MCEPTAAPRSDAAMVASVRPGRPSAPARLALALVGFYQRMTANRPSPCRYVPTCSSYSLDAFEQHGFVRGLWLTARRLSRCHPWGGDGWDPVPPRRDRHADPAKGLQP
jgi:putative membrane protein insertion efficiency factor